MSGAGETTKTGDAEAETAILAFIARLAPPELSANLSADTSLLGSGILDSLSVVELMTFVSEELGFEISDDDFTAENFDTVGSLVRLIARKRG